MDNINNNRKENQCTPTREVLPVVWEGVSESTPKTPFHSLKKKALKTSI